MRKSLLADDVLFCSNFTFKSRNEWLEGFPDIHSERKRLHFGMKITLSFATPYGGTHDAQTIRQGKAKIVGIGVQVTKTNEINDDGMTNLLQSSYQQGH